MLAEEPLQPGQVFKIACDLEPGKWVEKFKEYTVIRPYDYHVLCEGIKGMKRCITNAELMQKGIVKQKGVAFELAKQIKNMYSDNGSCFGVAKRWANS